MKSLQSKNQSFLSDLRLTIHHAGKNDVFAPLCPLNFTQISGLDVWTCLWSSVNRLCSRKKPAIQDEVALFTLSLNTCCSINKMRCISCFSFQIWTKNRQQSNSCWGLADVVFVMKLGGSGGGRWGCCHCFVKAAAECFPSFSLQRPVWGEKEMLIIKDGGYSFMSVILQSKTSRIKTPKTTPTTASSQKR